MSHRLQVLIPEELDARLTRAARRTRVSKGRLVREAIEEAIQRVDPVPTESPVDRMLKLQGPTVEMDELLKILDDRYGPLPE